MQQLRASLLFMGPKAFSGVLAFTILNSAGRKISLNIEEERNQNVCVLDNQMYFKVTCPPPHHQQNRRRAAENYVYLQSRKKKKEKLLIPLNLNNSVIKYSNSMQKTIRVFHPRDGACMQIQLTRATRIKL